MTTAINLHQALVKLAATINDMYAADGLLCKEADALAEVLVHAGYPDKAVTLLLSHIPFDDEQADAHAEANDLDVPGQAAWCRNYLGLES